MSPHKLKHWWIGLTVVASLASLNEAQAQSGGPSVSTQSLTNPTGVFLTYDPAQTRAESEAYCEYIEQVADSETALMKSPTLIGRTLTVHRYADTAAGVSTKRSEILLRTQVGAGFSPTRFSRANMVAQRTRAECLRYSSGLEVLRLLAVPLTYTRRPLESKIEVLDRLIGEGEQTLLELAKQVEASSATIQEHDSFLMRLADLKKLRMEARDSLAVLPDVAPVPAAEIDIATRRQASYEREAALADSRLRKSEALEIQLEAGYDRIWGVDQKIPIYAMASVQFAPGWFRQNSAERASQSAHAALVRAQTERVRAGKKAMELQLRRQLLIAKESLANATKLHLLLEARYSQVSQLPGPDAQSYKRALWVDRSKAEAERIYVEEYVKALELALRQ